MRGLFARGGPVPRPWPPAAPGANGRTFRIVGKPMKCYALPETVEQMHRFMEEQGYVLDITESRMHHEIYLSDARKVAPEKWRTVIRHPIRKER